MACDCHFKTGSLSYIWLRCDTGLCPDTADRVIVGTTAIIYPVRNMYGVIIMGKMSKIVGETQALIIH